MDPTCPTESICSFTWNVKPLAASQADMGAIIVALICIAVVVAVLVVAAAWNTKQ